MKLRRSNRGSALVESALLVAFICLVAASAASSLGHEVNVTIAGSAETIADYGVGTESGMERPSGRPGGASGPGSPPSQ